MWVGGARVAELDLDGVLGPMRAAGLSDEEIVAVLARRSGLVVPGVARRAAGVLPAAEGSRAGGGVPAAAGVEGEPPPGSVWCDPSGGVWVRGLGDGLWSSGSDREGNPEPGRAWALVPRGPGSRLVSSPPAEWSGPLVETSVSLELPVQVAREVGGKVVRELVPETVTVTQVGRAGG